MSDVQSDIDDDLKPDVISGAVPFERYSKLEVHEFDQFCSELLKSSSDVQRRAVDILHDAIDAEVFCVDPKMTKATIYSRIVYIAAIEARMPYGPNDPLLEKQELETTGVTVTDILHAADINISHLFRAMEIMSERLSLSKTVMDHFTNMKRSYLVLVALYDAFQSRLCPTVFRDDSKSDDEEENILPPIPETEGISYRRKQCWVLFLLAKHSLMPDNQELFPHFQLLLCCLGFILRHTPSFLLNTPYDTVRFDSLNSVDQGERLLRKLVEDFDISSNETLNLHTQRTEDFFQSLLTVDGELDSDSLYEMYQGIYQKEGDLNELLFLSKDTHLQPLSPKGACSPPSSEGKFFKLKMAPVREAISTVQHLEESLTDLAEAPSQSLKSIFQNCSSDPSLTVKKHINELGKKFRDGYAAMYPSSSQGSVSDYRFSLGLKLYYKVLGTLLEKESVGLAQHVLTTLLNKTVFHTSMLACALEVVLMTYSQSWSDSGMLTSAEGRCVFPWILDIFSLQAYDFYKVVESFIKAEPNLALDVVKHLQGVEFKILESLAWRENSSLFDVIGVWDNGQMTPPNASPVKGTCSSPQATNGQSRSAVQLFLSPVRHLPSGSSSSSARLSPSPAASALFRSSSESHGGNLLVNRSPATPRSQSLSHFLSRVCRLGFNRLTQLCNLLHIDSDVQHKIWTCFEYCVTKVPSLIKNRHIDQIILCSIFGMCKVVERDVTFKTIVIEYRSLPHARQEVFKNVYIKKDEEDSVIGFYNHIFMSSIKSYLLQFSPNNAARPQLSPMPKQAHASPSYSCPGKKNFTISPMKDFEFKTPASPSQLTPSSRMLYSFGDSVNLSSMNLRHINERVQARGRASAEMEASAKKRLNWDDMIPSSPVKKPRQVLAFNNPPGYE